MILNFFIHLAVLNPVPSLCQMLGNTHLKAQSVGMVVKPFHYFPERQKLVSAGCSAFKKNKD